MTTEKASVSIGRLTSTTDNNDLVEFNVSLPNRFIRLRMSLEEYALLITGRSEVPANVIVNKPKKLKENT